MIDTNAVKILFTEARTHSYWQDKPVDDALLQKAYDLARMAPTSANCQPMRIVFVKSKEAKEKLKSCLDAGNVEKTMAAPVTAIIAYDMEFYEQLKKYYPHTDARAWFAGKPEKISDTAFRNGTLQGGYFLLAARAVGLDCGPMSGFNRKKCDEAFFKDTPYQSNFLCNLGYGVVEKLHPRHPRPAFNDTCKII
ncbi:MAG: malonic semialdehyde reductase [Proteobacteria bacterium]|nr:malonic semialdehyde reductase [Pseudomonadota bacterium]